MTAAGGRVASARVWRLAGGLVAGLLVVAAILLGALRFAVALVPEHAARLQQWVEQQTRFRVEYTSLDARLRMFGPELVLRGLRVLDRSGSEALLEAREGSVGLDLWNLFRTGELVAGRVRLIGPAVTVVRLADGRIRLLGQGERPEDRPPFDLDRLPSGRVEIEDATVSYRDLGRDGRTWTFGRVRVALQRAHGAVEVAGVAQLPADLGTSIELKGELSGELDRFSDLEARLEARAARLSLAGLGELLPPLVTRPRSGAGPVSFALSVARGRLDDLRVEADLADVSLDLPAREVPAVEALAISAAYRPAGASPLSMPLADVSRESRPAPPLPPQARYATLAGRFRLRRSDDLWVFRATELRVRRAPDALVIPTTISGTWSGHPRSAHRLRLNANRLVAEDLWPLLLATAPAGFDRWAGLDPAGEVRQLAVELARERAGAEPRFAVSAELEGLRVRPSGRWPGLSGVSASLSGTDQAGRIALRAEAPSFEWPRMFRAPLTAERVAALLDWRRDGGAWLLEGRDVVVRHPQATADGSFALRVEPGRSSPVLTMDARIEHGDAALVARFIPVGRLRPRTIVWLENAFKGGRISNGRLYYQGPVRRFPFRHGEGEFIATADVSDARLEYFPGFAPLAGAAGSVTFRNQGLRATVREGSVGGVRLRGAELVIGDLKEPLLEIDATAAGDLGSALQVVQRSPLGPRLGDLFMQLAGQGPADYGLQLRLETGDQPRQDYTVRTVLRSATVSLPALRAPATRVSGEFVVHNLEMRSRDLRGTILDGPFEASVRPGPLGRDVTASVIVQASGRAAGAGLPAFIGLPAQVGMAGAADWRLDGRIERRSEGQRWPARFEVASDLRGLEIDAPRPFAKAAAEARPTRVALGFEQKGRNEVRVESGSARAVLLFAEGPGQRWDLERGAARFDGQPVGLPSRPGLHVAGDWPEFDLAEWLTLRARSGGGGRRLADWLGPVDVHLDRARALGFEFLDVTARLQSLDTAWRVDVSGPMAQGLLIVPSDFTGAAPLMLEMQHLTLQSAPGRDARRVADETDPRELPAVMVRTEEFTWQGRRFGRLQAQLRKEPLGLRLASLATESADFAITGTGTWLVEEDGPRTRLELEFDSRDLEATALALGYSAAVEAEHAHASASLSWRGGPREDVLARLDGSVRMELGRGQLTSVKPGAGRILGLTSIGALPRRLALDFRDVTEQGLAFDKVKGDFEIRAGNAYTRNLLLEGTAVDIGVVGRTGLAAQDYDQTVAVSGNPSGPITVAGALAGGPVGAAGALLFSQLFKGQLKGLARVYYRVTGPWGSPTVERISAAAGEQAAASPPAREGP